MTASWIRNLFGNKQPRTIKRQKKRADQARGRRLMAESLEDRTVPAGFPPSVSFSNTPLMANEGDNLSRIGFVSDIEGDLVTMSAFPGSITPSTITSTTPVQFTWNYTPLDQTAGPIGVTVSADDGTSTTTAGFNLTVANVAPSFTNSAAAQSALAGKTMGFSFGSFTDPGANDAIAGKGGWQVDIDWNYNGSTFAAGQTAYQPLGAVTLAHTYSSAGTYTVAAMVTDKDGGSSSLQTFTVTVASTVDHTYVDDNWAALPEGTVVDRDGNPGNGIQAATIGYDAWSKIQDALNVTTAGAANTVSVLAGTYAENLSITKAVSLLGPNAGISAGKVAGTRASEAVITTPTGTADLSGAGVGLVRIAASNVTLDGFTIDGDNTAQSGGVAVLGGADSNARRGVVVAGQNVLTSGVTVQNNRIQNFSGRGVQFGFSPTEMGQLSGWSTSVSDGQVTNNSFSGMGDPAFNDGFALIAFVSTPSFVGNAVTNANVGPFYQFLYNTTPVNVSGNAITVTELGFGFNETGGATPVINVTSNDITVSAADGTGAQLTAVANTGGAVLTGNSFSFTGTGAGSTGLYVAVPTGIFAPSLITVTGGSLNGFGTSVLVTSAWDYGPADGPASVILDGVTITVPTGGTGVALNGAAASTQAVSANLIGGTTITGTGTGTGVSLTGPHASATVGNATISGLTTGISEADGSLTVTGGSIKGNGTGIDFTGGTAAVGGVSFARGVGSANATDIHLGAATGFTFNSGITFDAANFYIDNPIATSYDLTAAAPTFKNGATTYSPATRTDNYRIEERIHHRIDTDLALTNGLITWVAGNVYVTATGTSHSIQRGIDAASNGNTVNVEAGTYADNLTVNKPLTLLGANAGIDPNTGTPVAPTIILPTTNDYDQFGTGLNDTLVRVTADNVVIDGFTLDGDNPTINGGYAQNGQDINIQTAISNTPYGSSTSPAINGLVVRNNVVKNFDYAGVFLYNSTGAVSHNNLITHNKFDNIQPEGSLSVGLGFATLIYNNAYATITDNVMTRVRLGVQTGNFYAAADGLQTLPLEISRNQIQSSARGIYYNLHYSAASAYTIADNVITSIANPMWAADNFNSTGGIRVQSIQGTVGVTVQNNTISGNAGSTTGYFITNIQSPNVVISGGSVNTAAKGVLVTNAAGDVSGGVSLSSLTITNTGTGVEINGDGTGLARASLSGIAIGNSTTGLRVSGANARLIGNTLGDTQFNASITGQFVELTNGATNGATIIDGSAARYDVGSGLQLPSAMTLDGKFALEKKLTHKPDSTALGLISFDPNNIYVPATQTIQGGIDAVPLPGTGWTVHVQSGTYAESPTINKPIMLAGQDKATTIISLLQPGTPGAGYLAPLFIAGTGDVTVSGFTIRGNNAVGSGLANSNIVLNATGLGTVTITNNLFEIGNVGTGTTYDDGIGILTYYTTTPSQFVQTLNVTNNTFVPRDGAATGQALRPFAINAGVNNFLFDGNTINGDYQYSALTSALHGTVSNNVYTGTDTTPGSRSGGFLAFGYPDATYGVTTFTNNTFSKTRYGIGVMGVNNVVATGNQISETDRGLWLDNSNNIAGFDPATLSATGNTFTNNLYHVAYTAANNPTGEYSPLGNTFDGVVLNGSTSLANLYTLADKVLDKIDLPGAGLVRLRAGNIYITPNSFYAPDTITPSLQRGIDAAGNGETVHVAGGTYSDNPTVNKPLTLLGANAGVAGGAARGPESRVVTNGNQNAVFTVSSNGVTIDGFTIDGDDTTVTSGTLSSGEDANALYGIRAIGALSGVNVLNNILTHSYIGFRGDGPTSGTAVSGNTIANNWFDSIGAYDFGYAVTLRTNFYADVTDNKMTRVHTGLLTNNFYLPGGPTTWLFQNNSVQAYGLGVWSGLQYASATPLTINNNQFTTITPAATAPNLASFQGHATGIMVVTLQDNVGVNITNNSITGLDYGVILYNTMTSNTPTINGTNTISNNGVGIYLTDIVGFNPSTSTVLGGSANNPNGVAKAILDGITLAGNGVGVLVRGTNPATPNGVLLTLQNGTQITGGTTGIQLDGSTAKLTGDTLATTTFTGQAGQYVVLSNGAYNAGTHSGQLIDGGSAVYDGVTGSAATLVQAFGIEDKLYHQLDNPTVGFVQLQANKAFVTPTSGSIQNAIDAEGIATNGTVYVQGGTYVEDVTINVNGLSLLGSGASSTTISGAKGGPGSTITVAANNVLIDGFTITREGNTVADWNDPSLNSAGISLNAGSGNTEIRNNNFFGNRTGIDINNTGAAFVHIHNNVIDSNRTGLILRNSTNNVLFEQNAVTNNFTVGIVFLDASGGTNSPVQSAVGSKFFNNNISGNWYGQIVDRQTGGSLPAPGATNLKDFQGNWFGTTNPVVSTANSAEPGYAAQIPTMFGGSAFAPGGQPDILGPASANFDFSPFLWTGTDTDPVAMGFQGDFTKLGATVAGASLDGQPRITEAIGYQGGSATEVNVLTGTYVGDADLTRPLTVRLQGAATLDSLSGVAGSQVDVNGQSLTYGDSTDHTFNGVFVGTGSVVKQGAGKSTLTGTSTGFSGQLNATAGEVALNGSLGGTVDVNTGATLSGTGTIAGLLTNNGTVSPAGTGAVGTLTAGSYTQSSTGQLVIDLNGATAGTGYDVLAITSGPVTLDGALTLNANYTPADSTTHKFIDNQGASAVSGSFTSLPNGTFFAAGSQPFAIYYTGGTGNDVVVVKIPSSTPQVTVYTNPTWTPANGFPIGTVIADADPNTAGNQSATVGFDAFSVIQEAANAVLAGGQIVMFGGSYTFDASPVTLNQAVNFLLRGNATLDASLGTAGAGENSTVDLNRFTLTVGGAEDTTFAGVIDGRGSFRKQGAGVMTLTGANTYNGTTAVLNGTLQAGADEVIPDTSAVTVNSGATLDLAGAWETIGSLAGSGNVTFGTTPAGELTVGSNGTSTTFGGSISGTGRLVKTGAGSLTLTGANTYTDGDALTTDTDVQAGSLQLGNGGTTGSLTSDVSVQDGTSLVVNRSGTVAQTDLLGTGRIAGAGEVVLNGTGTVTLATGNTYSGGTTVNRGTLAVGDDAQLGDPLGGVRVNAPGQVEFTASTTSGREFLATNAATIKIDNGVTLTLDNASVIGAKLTGPGSIVTVAGSSTAFSNVTTTGNTSLTLRGTDTVSNSTNSGQVTIDTGATVTLDLFTNTSLGRLTISGTAKVTDFISNGKLDVLSGGVLRNMATTDLILGGGSYSVIHSGASVYLGKADLRINSGSLTNEGTIDGIEDLILNGGPVRTVYIDFGSVFLNTGSALANVIYQNGGHAG